MNTHFLIWYYVSFLFVLNEWQIEKFTNHIETMKTLKPAIITFITMLQKKHILSLGSLARDLG